MTALHPPTAAPAGADPATGGERPAAAGPRWTRRRVLTMVGAYLAALALMIAVKGVFISPDRYFVILLAPAAALGLGKRYTRDFLPLVAAILLYEQARGLAHLGNPAAWYSPLIDFDSALFGGEVPSVTLQDWLWTGTLQWYDQALAVLQRMHFFVPPTLLFLVWLERRDLFYRAALTLVCVSFAGALAFLVFPAAPPWMASDHGYIPHLAQIGSLQAESSPVGTQRSLIANLLLPNPVAAVPSLHTAYSLITLLVALAWRRRIGYAFIAYPLLMWFTIVYFADHYVFDIVLGAGFALIAWWLVGRMMRPGGLFERFGGPFAAPLDDARGGEAPRPRAAQAAA